MIRTEIEKLLLVGLVMYPEVIPDVSDEVVAQDFALAFHARVFDAIVARNIRGDVIDFPLLQLDLPTDDLMEISAESVVGSDNVKSYAKAVSEAGVRSRVGSKLKS